MAMKSGEHVPSTPSLISYLFTASFCFSHSVFAHLTTLPLSWCLVSRTIKSPFEIRGPEIVLARNFFQIYVNKIWSFCFKMGSLSTMAMLELGTWNRNWWKLVRQAVMQYCTVDKRRGELMRVKSPKFELKVQRHKGWNPQIRALPFKLMVRNDIQYSSMCVTLRKGKQRTLCNPRNKSLTKIWYIKWLDFRGVK